MILISCEIYAERIIDIQTNQYYNVPHAFALSFQKLSSNKDYSNVKALSRLCKQTAIITCVVLNFDKHLFSTISTV